MADAKTEKQKVKEITDKLEEGSSNEGLPPMVKRQRYYETG